MKDDETPLTGDQSDAITGHHEKEDICGPDFSSRSILEGPSAASAKPDSNDMLEPKKRSSDSYGEKIMEFPLIYGNPAKNSPDYFLFSRKKYIGNKAYFCLSPNFCSNTACSFLSTATKPSGSFLTNQP